MQFASSHQKKKKKLETIVAIVANNTKCINCRLRVLVHVPRQVLIRNI